MIFNFRQVEKNKSQLFIKFQFKYKFLLGNLSKLRRDDVSHCCATCHKVCGVKQAVTGSADVYR